MVVIKKGGSHSASALSVSSVASWPVPALDCPPSPDLGYTLCKLGLVVLVRRKLHEKFQSAKLKNVEAVTYLSTQTAVVT